MESPDIGQQPQKRILSILLIIIFSGITIFQIINILTIAPNEYIFDIYGYFPLFYWMCILFLIIFCGVILSYCSIYKLISKSLILIFLALLIITCTLILQSKFLFFFTNGGDSLTHMGYIKDILFYSNITQNPYPITHIFLASIVMILDISPFTAMNYFPFFLFLIYFLSMCAIGVSFFKNTSFLYFFVGLSCLPVYGFMQTRYWPNMAMILFTPVLIYILLKCGTKYFREFFILWIIALFYISYGHNLYCLVWIILSFIILLVSLYYTKINKSKSDIKVFITIISILILSILFYYNALLATFSNIVYIFDILFRGGMVVEGQEGVVLGILASQLSPTPSVLIIAIRMALFNYGTFAIFSTLSSLIFLYIVTGTLFFKQKFNYLLFLISTCSFILYGFSIVNFIISPFGAARIFFIAQIFTIISIPLIISMLIKNHPHREKMFLSIMVIFFSSLAIISVFTVNYSPYFSNVGNDQITESKYSGMTMFFKYWENTRIIEDYGETSRFYQSIYGKLKANSDNMGGISRSLSEKNLSYDQYNTFAQRYGSNIYFINEIYPRLLFTGPIPSPFKSYEESDIYTIDTKLPCRSENSRYLKLLQFYNKVENDNTVNKFYTNSRMNIYIVY